MKNTVAWVVALFIVYMIGVFFAILAGMPVETYNECGWMAMFIGFKLDYFLFILVRNYIEVKDTD